MRCFMKKIVVFLLLICVSFNVFNFFVSAEEGGLNISAKAALVMCLDSCEVLYEKNAVERLPMASTTKIMTALILSEQPDLSKTITVTKSMVMVEGSSMGLLEGDIVSFRDLLYGMLLASGNDAANTVAYALGGSVEGFVKIMNKKAQEIGLKNTSFVTPSGLDDENHYTTVYDLALLTAFALKNDNFSNACSSKQAILYFGNPPYKRLISNHNKLLSKYEGLIGVKTGFTKRAGRCLVTAAKRGSKSIIAVTLNDPNDWAHHAEMLDYGFSKTVSNMFGSENENDTIPIICGDADSVRIRYETVDICTSLSGSKSIKKTVILPKFLYGPLSAGESVGRVEYYLNGNLIKTSDIFAVANIERINKKDKFSKRFWSAFYALFNNT